MFKNQTTHLSKLLAYILRHKPEEYGIILDENGYTNVDELINKLNSQNENINFEILQHIVDTNNKKRFHLLRPVLQYKCATQRQLNRSNAPGSKKSPIFIG